MFAGPPRHLCAQEPARDPDRSLIPSPESYHVQPAARLPGGVAARHPRCARSGSGAGRAIEPCSWHQHPCEPSI